MVGVIKVSNAMATVREASLNPRSLPPEEMNVAQCSLFPVKVIAGHIETQAAVRYMCRFADRGPQK